MGSMKLLIKQQTDHSLLAVPSIATENSKSLHFANGSFNMNTMLCDCLGFDHIWFFKLINSSQEWGNVQFQGQFSKSYSMSNPLLAMMESPGKISSRDNFCSSKFMKPLLWTICLSEMEPV